MPITSHTTYSAGSLRRRMVAVPVAVRACSTQAGSRVCANREKLASEPEAPPADNAAAISIAVLPFARRPGRAAFTIAAYGRDDALGAGARPVLRFPGVVV